MSMRNVPTAEHVLEHTLMDLDSLAEAFETFGASVLASTPDVDDAWRMAQNVLTLRRARIVNFLRQVDQQGSGAPT